MKRLFVFSLMALLVVAMAAFASQSVTVEEVGKDAYYDAVDAYYSGSMTAEQRQLLKAVDFQEPHDPGNIITRIGGPDGAGYTFIDNEEDNGPTYNWYDISDGTDWATADGLSDDDYIGPYDIGFNFGFYGATYSQFYIQSNGVINFTDQYITLSNTDLPNAGFPAMLAWFWDDMDPDLGTQGQCYFENMMIGDTNALIVSFHNWDEFNGSDTTPNVTAQVIIFEDGRIIYQYNNLDGAVDVAGATIGIQGDAGFAGLRYMYNGDPAGYPYAGLAVQFEGTPPDANLSGTVYDPNMVPISGATVQVGNASTTTDGSGNYSFTGMYSGTYDYAVSAPGFLTSTGTLTLQTGDNTMDFNLDENNPNADILVVDADPTPNGDVIAGFLNDAGYTTYYVTEFNATDFTAGYDAIFVFVGIFSNYYPVYTDSPEEMMMVDYLNTGGNLYIEGGDIFGYNSPANLLALLNLDGIADGSGDLTNVQGVAGTFTEGVTMTYNGENNWIDHINGINTSETVFTNPADGEGCAVLDANDNFNSACFSFELANLVDGDFTRADIVNGILDYWGMGGGGGPVTLTLTGTTTIVPPEGGDIVYDVHLVSTLPGTYTGVQFWTDVILPNGQTYGPLMVQPFTLVPFMDVFVTGMTQAIPGFAPGGTYTMQGHAGYNPGPSVMGDFDFEKIGVAADGVSDWAASPINLSGDAAEVVGLPAEFELKDVYPNPFNPSANVSVALPTAAELSVTVYNVMGQQVAELASGMHSAGAHSFVLDGSALSSGVYFVQATVPGELSAVQKVTLLK